MIAEINNLIIKVRLSKVQIINKSLLKKNEKILKSLFNSENNKKSDTKEVIIFDKKKNYKLIKALENTLLISLFFKINIEIIFYI